MPFDITYAVSPFFAWLVAGTTKFAVNSIKSKGAALGQIGYGGFPSNHTAIVTTAAFLVGLREGFGSAYFCIAATLAYIVVMDALSLRIKVGLQAKAINALSQKVTPESPANLRERMGHTPVEVAGGVATGFICAVLLNAAKAWLTY